MASKPLVCMAMLVGAVSLTTFTATNPDFNFVGVVEMAILGACCLVTALLARGGLAVPRSLGWLCGAAAALLLALSVRYIQADSTSAAIDHCRVFAGRIPKLECLLHLPYEVSPGARQLLFHLTALAVFSAAALIASCSGKGSPLVVVPLMVLPSIYALYQLSAVWLGTSASLAGGNYVDPGTLFEAHRGVVTSNPGWFWPLLAPGLALAGGGLCGARGARRGVSAAIFAVLMLALLANRQRGAYAISSVALLLCLMTASFFVIKTTRARLIAGATLLGLAALVIWQFQALMRVITETLRLPIRPEILSFDRPRWLIWKHALGDLLQSGHALFGYGYGSWHSEFNRIAQAVGVPNYSLDTAHNFFVQALFELGAAHTGLIAVLFTWIVVRSFRAGAGSLERRTSLGIFVALALIAAGVQEIDYINATYFQFALVAGFLCSRRDEAVSPSSRLAWTGSTLAAACILGSLVLWRQYSWGGYATDYLPGRERHASFQRWFRPAGAITAFARLDDSAYTALEFFHPPRGAVTFGGSTDTDFLNFAIIGNSLLLKNGSRFWGMRHRYEAGSFWALPQRRVGFALALPGLVTNLGIFRANGLYDWEPESPTSWRAERWCATHCVFDMARPRCANAALSVAAPRPDVSNGSPVTMDARVEALESAPDRHSPLAVGAVRASSTTINDPDAQLAVELPALSEQGWGYRVDISVDRVFSEGTARFLGIRLKDVQCR